MKTDYEASRYCLINIDITKPDKVKPFYYNDIIMSWCCTREIRTYCAIGWIVQSGIVLLAKASSDQTVHVASRV